MPAIQRPGIVRSSGVVRLHRLDVVAPRDRDPVLRALQLGLQGQEVLVRLQVRIALDRDQQSAERAGELVLRVLEFLELRRIRDGRCVHLDARGFRPRLRDLDQDLALLLRIALHGLDQVRDEVGATLVLVLHLAPRGLGPLLQSGNVVDAATGEHEAEQPTSAPIRRPLAPAISLFLQ
jgi:hypothetical protein